MRNLLNDCVFCDIGSDFAEGNRVKIPETYGYLCLDLQDVNDGWQSCFKKCKRLHWFC